MLEQSWALSTDLLMVLMMARLRAAPVAARVGYYVISARIIHGFAVTVITAAAR